MCKLPHKRWLTSMNLFYSLPLYDMEALWVAKNLFDIDLYDVRPWDAVDQNPITYMAGIGAGLRGYVSSMKQYADRKKVQCPTGRMIQLSPDLDHDAAAPPSVRGTLEMRRAWRTLRAKMPRPGFQP